MTLSSESWAQATPIMTAILKHPFIIELMDGTLPEEKFTFYIAQDKLYLADYGRALAAIAAKLEAPAHISSFLGFANDTMMVEQAMHSTFLGSTPASATPSPACALYTAYIARQLAFESVEVCVAAVLPCFWIYKAVGDYILEHQSKDNNPYQPWINTYGGEEYASAVENAISIHDALAAGATQAKRNKMLNAFLICSKMEWMFWDSAYRLEQWPL